MSACSKCGGSASAFLCTPCGEDLKKNLRQIPWLAARLAEAHAKLDKLAAPPARMRPVRSEDDEESPVPFNPRAYDTYTALHQTCVYWVAQICRAEHIEFFPVDAVPADFIGPLPTRGQWRMNERWQPVTADYARWLLANYLSIVNHEDAALCAVQIQSDVRAGFREINTRKRVYVGPCPTTFTVAGMQPHDCNEPLWVEWDDERDQAELFVTCWRCRQEHDVAELKQKIFARADNFLLTATELLRVLDDLGEHLPKNRFYTWKKDGRIRPRGWKHDGRITDYWIRSNDPPVFALSDVRNLMGRQDIPA